MKKETINKYNEALEYYKKCKSITKTVNDLKIGRKWFALYIRDKIEVINYQNLISYNQDVFSKIDTEEKAYWLGFFYADGYVSKNSNHIEISLQLSDINHLKKFNKFLNRTSKIHTNQNRCRISMNCKKLHEDLISKGCIPNKSLILKFPKKDVVSNYLVKHFIRGYFDGDGSIMHRTNKKYISPYISIIGTLEFIKDLRIRADWKILKIYKDKRHKNNTYFISYIGKYVYNMLDFLYEDASIYLDRKYKKYLELKAVQ